MTTPIDLPPRPFTFRQALELGLNRHRLASLVEAREVRVVLRGVYARADLPDTLLSRAQAAALVTSPHMVLCDRTAAWLHGVDVLDYLELDVIPPVETWVLRGHHRVERRTCRGGERDLEPRDYQRVHGVLVTTPLRTALDLGCRLRRRTAFATIEDFMRTCGVTRGQMIAELTRYFRRRGVIQLRALVPIADPRTESQGESWTRLEIIDHGLPAPTPQYVILHDGVELFRLDLAYPHARVCIEYDGREFHDGPEAKAYDERRREWLRQHGWTVIVVDKDSFTDEALDAWISELRQALRIAA